MNRPRANVAIVTRTKNRPTLLRRALESIAAQTYQDYVVVVVNDAGERRPVDECVAEIADHINGQIHVVHNDASKGREAAMNTGVLAADSQFLVILDDDDTWAPQFLELTVAQLEDSDVAGVATRSAVIYETISGPSAVESRREVLAAHLHDITLFEMLRRNYMPTNSFLYRRSVHDALGMYDETLPVLADWDFYLRVLQRFSIDFIDGPPLAFWHHREDSTGDLGNSSIATRHDHVAYDRTIRDRYLHEDVSTHQHLGSLLYVTELLDRLQKDAQARTDHIAVQVNELDKLTRNVNRMVDEIIHNLDDRAAEFGGRLRELNANAVTGNNRLVARFGSLEREIDRLRELVYSQTPRARLRSYGRLAHRWAQRARRR